MLRPCGLKTCLSWFFDCHMSTVRFWTWTCEGLTRFGAQFDVAYDVFLSKMRCLVYWFLASWLSSKHEKHPYLIDCTIRGSCCCLGMDALMASWLPWFLLISEKRHQWLIAIMSNMNLFPNLCVMLQVQGQKNWQFFSEANMVTMLSQFVINLHLVFLCFS